MTRMQSTKSSKAALALVVPAAEPDVLDRVIAIYAAPLLPGEKQADYAAIAARFVAASKPQDTIEEFLVRDVIDLTWEIFRLRRVKFGILKSSMGDGLRTILNSLGHGAGPMWLDTGDPLSQKWAAGDRNAQKEVEQLLKTAGLGIEEVTAKTLETKLDAFERLDRMLASAEARRNNALREIDRHRETLGAATRQSIEDIEDADFQDVETGAITSGARP